MKPNFLTSIDFQSEYFDAFHNLYAENRMKKKKNLKTPPEILLRDYLSEL